MGVYLEKFPEVKMLGASVRGAPKNPINSGNNVGAVGDNLELPRHHFNRLTSCTKFGSLDSLAFAKEKPSKAMLGQPREMHAVSCS